jgi:UDP:flavonoid glycosyltransferase YjiC (YdhE family)
VLSPKKALPKDKMDDNRFLCKEHLPFEALLHNVDLLCYNGGIGSLMEAIHAGIMHVVIPCGFDQADNASLLSNLGVGSKVSGSKLNDNTLAKEMKSLLNSDTVKKDAQVLKEKSIDRQQSCPNPWIEACTLLSNES